MPTTTATRAKPRDIPVGLPSPVGTKRRTAKKKPETVDQAREVINDFNALAAAAGIAPLAEESKASARESHNIETITRTIAACENVAKWVFAQHGGRRTKSGGVAPPVTFVIQTRGQKRGCQGWFGPARWSTREGTDVHEITICAEILHQDPVDTAGTIIHECAHVWNHDQGIKDCSKSDRHNKEFKNTAEFLGLVVTEVSKSRGWADTTLSPEMRERVTKELHLEVAAFDLARKTLPKSDKPKAPTMAKWACSCDKPQIVRASRDMLLNAHCPDCDRSFEKELRDGR